MAQRDRIACLQASLPIALLFEDQTISLISCKRAQQVQGSSISVGEENLVAWGKTEKLYRGRILGVGKSCAAFLTFLCISTMFKLVGNHEQMESTGVAVTGK